MRDHRKLKVFESADETAWRVYGATASVPDEETAGMASELRRAAMETCSQVVSGCARSDDKTYFDHLELAYGSAQTLEYRLALAKRLGFLDENTWRELSESAVSTCKLLFGLINSIRERRGDLPPRGNGRSQGGGGGRQGGAQRQGASRTLMGGSN